MCVCVLCVLGVLVCCELAVFGIAEQRESTHHKLSSENIAWP